MKFRPDSISKLIQWLYDLKAFVAIRGSGLFNSRFYLEQNPDVARSKMDPLWHYVRRGWKEGRQPSVLFDSGYYLRTYPDVELAGVNPLLHYISRGDRERRNPHPLFETDFYRGQLGGKQISSGTGLSHYLSIGGAAGLSPHPLFDPKFYLAQNPKLLSVSITPLENLLLSPFEELKSPSVKFDIADYFRKHPEVVALRANPLLHSVMMQNARAAGISHKMTLAERTPELSEIRFARSESPKVSIVIPFYNQIPTTLRCLSALMRTVSSCACEIILVDDCSPDPAANFLREIPGVIHIRNQLNLGYLRSCNVGAARATGEFIVPLNNDTEPQAGWVEALLSTFERESKVGLVGAKLVYPDGTLQEAGGVIFHDGSGANIGKGDDPSSWRYQYLKEVDYCSGACLMISRNLWQTLGGFDESFAPAYYEDTDLAFRVREAGYRVLYQPLATIIHFEGVSCGKDTSSGIKRYQVENRSKFAAKWQGVLTEQKWRGNGSRPSIKPRALLIDAATPTPDRDSGSCDSWNTIKLLKEFGYEITFIPTTNLARIEKYTDALQGVGVAAVYAPYTKSVSEFLRKEGAGFRLVMIHREPIARQFLGHVKKYCTNAKVIFNTVDIHYLRERREAILTSSFVKYLRSVKIQLCELRSIWRADATMVVSSKEREILLKFVPARKVTHIPVIREVPGSSGELKDRRDVLFVGGFNHPPNVDAVLYMAQEIWPKVRELNPGIQFVVVGSKPPPELLRLNSENSGIKVLGFVEDLSKLLSQVRLTVAPLRFGAGIKGKILSSLSHGVPCVATPLAVEGMGLTEGMNVLVGLTPTNFQEAICRIIADDSLWSVLSRNGVDFVKGSYSFESVRPRFRALLESLDLPVQK